MSDDLNAFLDKAEDEPAAAPEAPPAEAAAPEAPAEAAPPEADADPEPEAADEAGIRKALAAERDKRRDWKEKAIRAETERDMLMRQLEEARRGPVQQAQQFQQPVDNPFAYPPPVTMEDLQRNPNAFVERQQLIDRIHDDRQFNSELNRAEEDLREKIGDEEVDKIQAAFAEMVAKDPSLKMEMRRQRAPYKWVQKQVAAYSARAEIGDDPAAYKAKLEAEFRAKWEAERGEQPLTVPTRSPAAGLPPSLANARNAAPRSAPAFNGPPPLSDVFPS